MSNNRKFKEVKQSYAYDMPQDEWQEENIRLRAGEGSAYDKYRHLTHKTGYGYDTNRNLAGWGRPGDIRTGTVSKNYQPVHFDNGFKGRYELSSRSGQDGLSSGEFFSRFLDLPARFIDDVADYLDTDVESAYRITRAVFLAIRDRVDPRFAVFFGQSLPLILRGIYFDDFNLSRVPVVIRDKNKFINFIQNKIPGLMRKDFNDPREIIMGLRAVFRVLERNMTQATIREMKRLLHTEIVDLIDAPQYEYHLRTA